MNKRYNRQVIRHAMENRARDKIDIINHKVIMSAGRGQTERTKLWAKEVMALATIAMLDLSEKCSRYAVIELPNSEIIANITDQIYITKIRLDDLLAELEVD